MYVPNTGAASYIKQTLMDTKNLISNTTILTGDLNTLLSQKIGQADRQKFTKN